MKRRCAGIVGGVLLAVASLSCGEGRRARHEGPAVTAVEPTPDTTPVETLRTPAGLVLKPETGATPPAGATAAPSAPTARATP